MTTPASGRSWRFLLVLILATAALLVGVAAFALGLANTSSHARQALADAEAASRRANHAAVLAILAARHAESAHRQADTATSRLCVFLGRTKNERIDERHIARQLFVAFACKNR